MCKPSTGSARGIGTSVTVTGQADIMGVPQALEQRLRGQLQASCYDVSVVYWDKKGSLLYKTLDGKSR